MRKLKKYRVDLEGHVSVEVEAYDEAGAEMMVYDSIEFFTRHARWEIEPHGDAITELHDKEGGDGCF